MKPKINSCETPDNKTWKNYMYYLSSLFVYNSLNMKKKIFELNRCQNHNRVPLLLKDRGENNQGHLKGP